MPDRHGIIVDPGAYTNLIGEETARIFAAMAVKNGHEPKQWRMKTMFIQGVGNGQQRCEWKVSLPIACMFSTEGQEPQLCYFEAPVVGGTRLSTACAAGSEIHDSNVSFVSYGTKQGIIAFAIHT